jgi:hypothetical protein
MIQPAAKYAALPAPAKTDRAPRVDPAEAGARLAAQRQQAQFPSVFIPVFPNVNFRDWFWRETKDGGLVHTYLRRQHAQQRDRLRAAARRVYHHQQNPQSEMRKRASIPLYEYISAPKTTNDPHFWDDLNAGLKWLAKDNPEWRDVIKT